jgi:hypothetical protein
MEQKNEEKWKDTLIKKTILKSKKGEKICKSNLPQPLPNRHYSFASSL